MNSSMYNGHHDSLARLMGGQELGIDRKRISALHTQPNGIGERLNRTRREMLRKTTDQWGDDRDLEIPFVQFYYMNHNHSASAYSPFYPSYGYNPRTNCYKAPANIPSVGIHAGLASQISTFWSCCPSGFTSKAKEGCSMSSRA